MNIILVGAQGSGKGTQADRLEATLGIPHVASGDLLRKAFDEQTELGIKAKVYLDRGELVPDDITVPMVLGRLLEPDCSRGVLFDGFPRTIAQAQALDKGLQDVGRQIDLVIYLNVPRQELLERLSGRYICRANQHVYNAYSHPLKVPGGGDLDGRELYQRSDDTGQAVRRRRDNLFTETVLLPDY